MAKKHHKKEHHHLSHAEEVKGGKHSHEHKKTSKMAVKTHHGVHGHKKHHGE